MNFKVVLRSIGLILIFIGISMVVPIIFAIVYKESDLIPLLFSMVCITILGSIMFFIPWKTKIDIRIREGFAIVSLAWFISGISGALPFYLFAHLHPKKICKISPQSQAIFAGTEFCSFTNCVFESVSGFTTTGSSILYHGLWDTPNQKITDTYLPHGILLWRSLIQWLGGMGIIVLSIAILPLLGVGGRQLFKAEVPGPTVDTLTPRIRNTAKLLWIIYIVLSIMETILLMLGGVDFYNALSHTFTTMPTGGFSPLAQSVAGFKSLYVEIIIMVFMFLAGFNFSLHYSIAAERKFNYWKSEEARFYIVIVVLTIAIITFLNYIYKNYNSIWDSFRYASFQVVSIITTAGYSTADFIQWTDSSQIILLLLMFIGASAGSTGGGIKCVRIWLLLKYSYTELLKQLHPRAIITVRLDHKPVSEDILKGVAAFFILYIVIFILGSIIMAAMGYDIITAVSSVATTLCNVGPGLGKIGPALNFYFVSLPGKWLLILFMLLGRLELYTVMVLFTKPFWKS